MADQESPKDKSKKKGKKEKTKKIAIPVESPPTEVARAKSSIDDMQRIMDNPDDDNEIEVEEEEPIVADEEETELKPTKSLKITKTQSSFKKSKMSMGEASKSRMKIIQDKISKSKISLGADKSKSKMKMDEEEKGKTDEKEAEKQTENDGKKKKGKGKGKDKEEKKEKKEKASKKSKKVSVSEEHNKEREKSIADDENVDVGDGGAIKKRQVTIDHKQLDDRQGTKKFKDVQSSKSSLRRDSTLMRGSRDSRSSRVSFDSVCTSSTSSYSDDDLATGKKITGKKSSAIQHEDAKDKLKSVKPKRKLATPKESRILVEDVEVIERIFEPSVTSVTPVEDQEEGKPKEKKDKKAKGKKKGKKVKKEKAKEPLTEEELKKIAEEEKLKAIAEKRDAVAKEKKELQEGIIRSEQLDITLGLKAVSEEVVKAVMIEEQTAEEWRQYLVCDGLPAPWDVPSMNTYLHLWEKEIETVSVEKCKHRTTEAITLLEKLEDIIDDPFDTSERKLHDWKWVASLFRQYQEKNLEFCTYRLLRDIKNKLNRISIPSADYRFQENLLSMCVYVAVTLPTGVQSVRTASKNKISLNWPEVRVEVTFPSSLKCEYLAIRGMYLRYDHLSDTCPTFTCPMPLPEYYTKTLKNACQEHLIFKQRYKYDRREIIPVEVPPEAEDGTATDAASAVETVQEEEIIIPPDEMPPIVPYQKLEPSPSAALFEHIKSEMENALYCLVYDNFPEYILNQRQFTTLGGIYCLDLFYQPPQPQCMVSYEVSLSTLIEPFEIQRAPFSIRREIPEVELRATRTKSEFKSLIAINAEDAQYEKELEDLIVITLKLSKHVYWFIEPVVTQWDDEYNSWSIQNVFNPVYNEVKGTLQFRTNQFHPVALATYRWVNLPYKTWEIRPEQDGTVSLLISAAILNIEFHVVGNTLCVVTIQGGPNDAFDQHLGVYYGFSKLRKIMRNLGIDVFPYFDTFLYSEGNCEKFWPMEDHLYLCMAYISTCYNIIWSKWNSTMDPYSIVFLMRLLRYDRHKQADFDTVLVQLTRTLCVVCTEDSEQFSEDPMEGMRFFADLWHMTRLTATKAIKNRIARASQTMIHTLYRLYRSIRFLSFSNLQQQQL